MKNWVVQGEVGGLTVAVRIGVCTHQMAMLAFRRMYPTAENVRMDESIHQPQTEWEV